MVIFVRSFFECRALIETDRVASFVIIIILQQVDEILQADTMLLQVPQGTYKPPMISRVWRATFGRRSNSRANAVPYATPISGAPNVERPKTSITTPASTKSAAVPISETSKKTL